MASIPSKFKSLETQAGKLADQQLIDEVKNREMTAVRSQELTLKINGTNEQFLFGQGLFEGQIIYFVNNTRMSILKFSDKQFESKQFTESRMMTKLQRILAGEGFRSVFSEFAVLRSDEFLLENDLIDDIDRKVYENFFARARKDGIKALFLVPSSSSDRANLKAKGLLVPTSTALGSTGIQEGKVYDVGSHMISTDDQMIRQSTKLGRTKDFMGIRLK